MSTKPFAAVDANPYAWPFDGDWTPANTALVIIDMQTDFCRPRRLRRPHGLRPVGGARARSGRSTNCSRRPGRSACT